MGFFQARVQLALYYLRLCASVWIQGSIWHGSWPVSMFGQIAVGHCVDISALGVWHSSKLTGLFSARACYCYHNSVRLSVCLSVTLVIYD